MDPKTIKPRDGYVAAVIRWNRKAEGGDFVLLNKLEDPMDGAIALAGRTEPGGRFRAYKPGLTTPALIEPDHDIRLACEKCGYENPRISHRKFVGATKDYALRHGAKAEALKQGEISGDEIIAKFGVCPKCGGRITVENLSSEVSRLWDEVPDGANLREIKHAAMIAAWKIGHQPDEPLPEFKGAFEGLGERLLAKGIVGCPYEELFDGLRPKGQRPPLVYLYAPRIYWGYVRAETLTGSLVSLVYHAGRACVEDVEDCDEFLDI